MFHQLPAQIPPAEDRPALLHQRGELGSSTQVVGVRPSHPLHRSAQRKSRHKRRYNELPLAPLVLAAPLGSKSMNHQSQEVQDNCYWVLWCLVQEWWCLVQAWLCLG